MELRLIPGLISSLLPDDTRRSILPDNCEPTAHDSALSGLSELLFSVSTLAWMYFHIVPAAINGYVGQASAHPGGDVAMVEWAGGVPVAYGMGLSALAGFLLRWQTFAAAYFAFEGSVRTFAGFGADQVVPSMPLFVLEMMVQRGRRALYRLKLPPIVVDELTRDGRTSRGKLSSESGLAPLGMHSVSGDPVRGSGGACWNQTTGLGVSASCCAGAQSSAWITALRSAGCTQRLSAYYRFSRCWFLCFTLLRKTSISGRFRDSVAESGQISCVLADTTYPNADHDHSSDR